MNNILWISLGAIFGANLRYYVGRLSSKYISSSFPYGTFLINITGSFILGFFLTWSLERVIVNAKLHPLIAIGFCGSYTTFSSYSYETMALFEQGHYSLALINFCINNFFALLAIVAGSAVARGI